MEKDQVSGALDVSMPTAADQAAYIYDDLGQLSPSIDRQGNVATYTYGAVGNLLSNACLDTRKNRLLLL